MGALEQKALDAAIGRRAKARQGLADAEEAVARARAMADAAEASLARSAATEDDFSTRHAQRLEEWIVSGGKGNAPVMADDDAVSEARRTAERARSEKAAAAKALGLVTAACNRARQEVEDADASVSAAVSRLISAEADDMAGEIAKLEARALTLREQLAAIPGTMGAHGVSTGLLSETAMSVMNNPPAPWSVSTLLSENPYRMRTQTIGERWSERIAQLRETGRDENQAKAA
ncbi:hypothetical protein [Jiella sp. M17.18]|uniref:hypothetical protein n=1 Tax=Jiella sp. M17.18 TaxID=3234247 RepID=UPI0034DE536F